ncbi:unnamed protein product [Paramecium sonneborni]|uniref:Uncharacterized protein n=1 Tax=Paramecium sonneborni TaxID=65129 RepID=A0A8S1QGH5_9CILI|nr:unnamed protein product [Paramecium sonneborni]
MQEEDDERFFSNNYISAIEVFVHTYSKDIMEEYGRSTKKRKGNEYFVYKDLSDRNAVLTIYRSVSYNCNYLFYKEQPDNQPNIVNTVISWLQNHQKTILPKMEKEKLGEKSFLKHILTQKSMKSPDQNALEYMKQNVTLLHYVNEAAEKQAEGFVNNVLMMVQAIKSTPKQFYINYFAQAVALQMRQTKKPLNPTETSFKANKVIFINLSGKESLINLDHFQQYLDKSDEFIYFSFINIQEDRDIQTQFKDFQIYFNNMKSVNSNFNLFPYLSHQNKNQRFLLHGQLLKTFFSVFMHNRIEKFSHNSYIALSLSLSDDIDYDTFGIQFLIQKLIKLSHNKLIIHIDIEINEDRPDFLMKLTQLMNLCYSSFQEQNITIQQLIPKEKQELYRLIQNIKVQYQKLELYHLIEQFQYTFIQLQNQFQEICEIQNDPCREQVNQIQKVFYKKDTKRYLTICPLLENNHQITPYTQIIINYQDDIIILYQNGESKFLYFLQIENQHFKDQNKILKIQFKNISNILDFDKIQNQIVFYLNSQIYVLYGQQNYQINMKCTRFNIKTQEQTILLFNDKEKLNQGSFHSKIAFSKFTNEQLQERIKARVSPTVCIENSNEHLLKIVIFGGENIESPQIMNLIEYVEIRSTDFVTGILDKSVLFKELSFKPYPNQTVLEFKNKNDTCYLILPGNDILRQKSQNHPINSQFSQNAIILIKKAVDFSISNIPITYFGKQSYGLSYITNSQSNSQIIYQDEQQQLVVWRVIYTQSLKIESIQKLKLDYCLELNTKQDKTLLRNENGNIFLIKDQKSEIEMIISYLIQIELDEEDIQDHLIKIKDFDEKRRQKLSNNLSFYQNDSNAQQFENIQSKLEKKQIYNLMDQPQKQKDEMQLECGNQKDQQENNNEYFKQNVLDNYNGDNNQLYSVAFESYIYLDLTTKQLSVKQFTYLLGEALALPCIDNIITKK